MTTEQINRQNELADGLAAPGAVSAARPEVATVTRADEPVRPFLLSAQAVASLALLVILVVAAYFRFTGLDWAKTQHLHPDERFLTIVASTLSSTDPLTYLSTSQSTLNPYNAGQTFYVYGNFPMTVTRLVAEWAEGLCSGWGGAELPFGLCADSYTAYDGIHLVGRFLSTLVDLISIFFTFLIARRLYGWRAGLLAAFMLATAVMAIQQSHFFTMDNWAAALTTITMYAAVRMAGIGEPRATRFQLRWALLFGVSLGLAVASRINVAPLALMAVVAAGLWIVRQPAVEGDQAQSHAEQRRSWVTKFWRYYPHAVTLVAVAALASLVTFRLAQPYAFADSAMILQNLGLATVAPGGELTALDGRPYAENPASFGQMVATASLVVEEKVAIAEATGERLALLKAIPQALAGILFNHQWLSNMAEIQRLQTPEMTFPPALQWTDRTPILFPLTNMILYGMGPLAGLVAWGGFLLALWFIARARPGWHRHLLPVAWVGFYFLFMGTRWVTSIRYFLPIYPILFVLAGWAIVWSWQRARRGGARDRFAVAGLLALVVASNLIWARLFVGIYQQPVTRLEASAWMYQHVPSAATLTYVADGQHQEMQLPLRTFEFVPVGEPGSFPLVLNFQLPEDGTVSAIRFNYLSDPDADLADAELLNLRVMAAVENRALAEANVQLALDNSRQPVLIDLDDVPLEAGRTYTILANALSGGRIHADTSVIMNEHWDDPLPVRMPDRDAFGSYYQGIDGSDVPITGIDSEEKRQMFYHWLEEADYIALSSQRALWSLPRLPLTYPMTSRYYEALFSGELGFELVHQSHADFHVGPLYFSDTGGKIAWGKPPQIGWPPPGDLAAEEAFSVYDHPPVWIFAKTEAFSRERVESVLGEVDLSRVIPTTPGEATTAPNGLMLSPDDRASQQAGGTFSQIFQMDGAWAESPILAAAVWWLAAALLGWLAFPLAFLVFPGLADRGYPLSRILALLVVSYLPWLAASIDLLPHTRGAIWLAVALLIVVSLIILLRRHGEIVHFVRSHLALIGLVEILALALFLLQLGIRLGNPDVWDVIWGGEKPMDLAYFTAVLKSTSFPAYDPWFAGGTLNYYYYGFVYVGALVKLLGIIPTVAYNLILPLLFSLTGLGAFSIAYNLTANNRTRMDADSHATSDGSGITAHRLPGEGLRRSIIAGLAAMTLAVLLGNLGEVGVLVGAWQRTSDLGSPTGLSLIDSTLRTLDGAYDVTIGGKTTAIYPGDWFWTASRALNAAPGEAGPITEFPYFTFLYGDLHAHMISLPLMLLALGWVVSLALMPVEGPAARSRWQTVAQWLLGALAIGVLRATNTWDWPTYVTIGGLAVLYHRYRQDQAGGQIGLKTVAGGLLQTVALVGLSYLAFLPYIANFGSAYGSFALWQGSYTTMLSYLRVYGLFLFLALGYLWLEFRSWTATWTRHTLAAWEPYARPVILALLAYVILITWLLLAGYWIAPIVLTLIIASGLLMLRPGLVNGRRVLLALLASALGLTLFVEIFVVEGDIGRMNTVFKFYNQTWLLLSVVGGVAFARLWPASRRWGRRSRKLWRASLALLVGAAALYPLLATPAKWSIRMSDEAPHTLDGMAFMPTTQYAFQNEQSIPLEHDYEALRWMQRHIEGSPVVAEAAPPSTGHAYRSTANRVAMYTGLPAIIGWDWHQTQQRSVLPSTLIHQRMTDVQMLYNTTNPAEALAIMEKYDVKYIYVGHLERIYYTQQGLLKFDQMAADGLLTTAYRNDGATIYEVQESRPITQAAR